MEPPPSSVPVNSQLMDASALQLEPQSSTLLQPQLQQQQQQPNTNLPQQLQPHAQQQQQPNPHITQPQQQQSNSSFTQQQQQRPQQSSFPQQQQQQPNRLPFNDGTQPAWVGSQAQSASQVAQLPTQPATPKTPLVAMNSQAVDNSPSQLQSSGFPQQQLQQQQQQHTSSPSIPSTNYPQQQQPQTQPQLLQQPQQQQQQQPYRISFNSGAQPLWMGSQPHSGSQYAQFSPSSASLRGGIAIGVPSQPTSSIGPRIPVTNMSDLRPRIPSTSLGGRNPANNNPDSRCQISGTGITGSQQVRPGGVPQSQSTLQRPVLAAASGTRPPSTTTPPQNFQCHGIFSASSASVTNSPSPSTSQGQQSSYQPWLSAQHGRPPLPSQSVRPHVTSSPSQQRSLIPQLSVQPMPASSQPQQSSSPQQQQQYFPASNMSHENSGQQLPSSRVPQPLTSEQNAPRVLGSSSQNPPSPAMGQASVGHAGPMDKTSGSDAIEFCSRILSKRSILELVNQVDPSEKLDPEVEDILADIAEDFIDSVATSGCSLAKHRKSNTLEAKDILLHIENTWKMTLPGFSGDEIKTYKKPVANDIHKERLAVIRKSQAGAEMIKSSAGQATGNPKGSLAKVTPTIIGS